MAEEIIKYPDMAEKIARSKQEHDNKEQKEIDDRKAKYRDEINGFIKDAINRGDDIVKLSSSYIAQLKIVGIFDEITKLYTIKRKHKLIYQSTFMFSRKYVTVYYMYLVDKN